MSAQTVTRAPISDTDANFRLWGKAISDQFAAGGLIQTADTGQINWTTVTAPGAINTYQGYEIWRSNDAAGGIVNWYMKIEYGSNASNANQPRIRVTFGWGSNGSGTLTGTTSTAITPQVNTTGSATLRNCNLAAGNNWAVIVMFADASSHAFFFSVERTKDPSLADQNEILIVGSDVTSYRCQVISNSQAYPQESLGNANAILPSSSNSVQGGQVGLGMQFGVRAGFTNPSMNLLGVNSGQLGSAQSQITVPTYGSNHNYIINPTNSYILFGGLSQQLMTRFE